MSDRRLTVGDVYVTFVIKLAVEGTTMFCGVSSEGATNLLKQYILEIKLQHQTWWEPEGNYDELGILHSDYAWAHKVMIGIVQISFYN